MNFLDNIAAQWRRRNHGLITLGIAVGIVASSAGLVMLPALQTPVSNAAPLLQHTPVAPGAAIDTAPAAVVSPDENLSETDRELLAFRPHGG